MPQAADISESRSSSRASSTRSTSSPQEPSNENDQSPARPGPISRLISSSARLPSHLSSSHSSTHSTSSTRRRQRPDRQSSTTSSSRASFEREGRPPHPRNSSSTTSTRRKPRPQNVAGPSTEQAWNAGAGGGAGGSQNLMFNRMNSQAGGSTFNGGSTASGASQTGGDPDKPLWAVGGVFPTKDRRKSSVAKDWAKSREKERRELKRQERKLRRVKGPERMDSAITEHSSTVGGEGDGGLPSDTIVEQDDPFDRYNNEEWRASGEETDESANAQSENSGMSRGGSTVGHPVKRQDHEDGTTEIESTHSREEPETASQLARRKSPGESTLAEQDQRKHDEEYDEKVDRGRDQVEQDSKKGGKTPRSGRNGGEDFDEDSWSIGSRDSGTDSDSPQVGGQLNQNKEDWHDDMNPDGPPVRNAWGTVRYALREPMAEFLGTVVLVVLGIGCKSLVLSSTDLDSFADSDLPSLFAADCQVKISGATVRLVHFFSYAL